MADAPVSREIAQRFAAAHVKLTTLAVTGTNGKTTTVSMLESIVRASGEPSARLTTLGAAVAGQAIKAPLPEDEFLETVETAVAKGVQTLALEVTSKALAAGLARGWPPTVAVFTNLSRDHLDMHPSAEHYFAAKAQLFLALRPGGIAVLNGDDDNARLLLDVIPPHASVRRFSTLDITADLATRAIRVSENGTELELAESKLANALEGTLTLGAVGRVHAENAMAAALAADAAGYDATAIKRGLANFVGVAGRFEIVSRSPLVVVDYAHTPDGLIGTLATARELVTDGGELICVFGCGGDRDRGKRPEMGRAADAGADRIILTSDNPRFENPQAIADDVIAGVKSSTRWSIELDRKRAILKTIRSAEAGDVVVIAGKGHEAFQEVEGKKHPMSDRAIAESIKPSDVSSC